MPEGKDSTSTALRTDVEAPPEIAGYEIGELLGSGSMGGVYRAHELGTDRDVAIKWIPLSASAEVRSRFQREGRAAAAVRHPNIVSVLKAGETDRGAYLVMELVDGFPLETALSARALGPRALAEILAKVARALQAAHEKGVVHRDVKPANILIDSRSEPRIVDFGLARFTSQEGALTGPGMALGTLVYMAPEVAQGGAAKAGPASDVFSLGAILFEGLAGKPPYAGETARETAQNVLSGNVGPIPDSAPRPLVEICKAAIARDPAQRPTALALAKKLEAESAAVASVALPAAAKAPAAQAKAPSLSARPAEKLPAPEKPARDAGPGAVEIGSKETLGELLRAPWRRPRLAAGAVAAIFATSLATGAILARAGGPPPDSLAEASLLAPLSSPRKDAPTSARPAPSDPHVAVATPEPKKAESTDAPEPLEPLAMAPEPAPDPDTEMPGEKVPRSDGVPTMPQAPQASPSPGEKDPTKDEDDLRKLRATLNDALKRDDRPAIDKAAHKILDVAPRTEKLPRSVAYTALGRNELLAGHARSAETEFAESLALVPGSAWTIFESLCAALVADDSSLVETRRKALKEHAADGQQYLATGRLLLTIHERGDHAKRGLTQVEMGQTADPPVTKAVVAALRRRNK